MTAVEIREVTPDDAAVWAQFRLSLWPDATIEDLSGDVARFFAGGSPLIAAALLAWAGSRPVGFVELSVRAYVPGADSLPAPFLEGWFVDPEWRRQGIGRRLVGAAEEWAKSRGYAQLGSDALMSDLEAAEAHEAVGFRPVEEIRSFIKDLGDVT